MEKSSTPDFKRTKLLSHQRTISPRLNQLLQLFQSKAQDQTPKRLFKRDGESPERKTPRAGSGAARHIHHRTHASFDNLKRSDQMSGYPNYKSSLTKSLDLDKRPIATTLNNNEKQNQGSHSRPRTPYSRVSSSKKPVLSRQKSLQSHTEVVTKERGSEREESPAEQLRSVNYLLKGSKGSFLKQDSKDQGYCTDTSSIKSENVNEKISQEDVKNLIPEENVKVMTNQINSAVQADTPPRPEIKEDVLGNTPISRPERKLLGVDSHLFRTGVQAKTPRKPGVNFKEDGQGYILRSPEPSLDELMKAKLSLDDVQDSPSVEALANPLDKVTISADLDKEKDHFIVKCSEDAASDRIMQEKTELDEKLDLLKLRNGSFSDRLQTQQTVELEQKSPKVVNEIVEEYNIDKLTDKCLRKSFDNQDKRTSIEDVPSDSFRGRSNTDSILNKKRRTLSRSRSSIVMKPPRRLCISESERGIQLDENGVLQIMNDLKGMKTCLLRLKRELQEAPLQSPLSTMSTGSPRFFDDSFVSPNSSLSLHDVSSSTSELSGGPRKLVRRTTVDSCVLKRMRRDALDAEKITSVDEDLVGSETKQDSQLDDRKESLERLPSVERLQSVFEDDKHQTVETDERKEDYQKKYEELQKEIVVMRNEMQQIRQERNCHMIAREELEHEVDSKNYTIKLLQTQLEGQECRSEVQNLKEEIENLKAQVKTQQNEIYRLVQNGVSPGQLDVNSRGKNYWTELRTKLKDAMINTVQTTAHYYSTPETLKTLKKFETE